MNIRLLALFMLGLLLAQSAHAAALTLDECIQRAVKENSGVKAEEMRSVSAGEEMTIARSQLLPSLRLRGSYSLYDKSDRILFATNAFAPGIPPGQLTVPTGEHSLFSLSLIVEQPLFTGGRLYHTLGMARESGRAASLIVARKRREIALEVTRVFREVLIERLNVDAARSVVEAKRERLRMLRERQAEGYTALEELLRQEADIAFAETDLLKYDNRMELAKSRLRRLIYVDSSEELELSGIPRNTILELPLNEALITAVNGREDLKATEAREAAADQEVRVARSGFFPQAYLQGRYTRQTETNITRPEQWVFSAHLDWSVFEWGRTRSEVARKAAVRQQVHYEVDELRREILLLVEQVWRRVKEQEKRVMAHETKLKAVEFLLAQALERYVEGEVALSEVMALEAELVRVNADYNTSIANLDVGMSELETVISSPLSGRSTSRPVYKPDFGRLASLLKIGAANWRSTVPEQDEIARSSSVTKSFEHAHYFLERLAEDK